MKTIFLIQRICFQSIFGVHPLEEFNHQIINGLRKRKWIKKYISVT